MYNIQNVHINISYISNSFHFLGGIEIKRDPEIAELEIAELDFSSFLGMIACRLVYTLPFSIVSKIQC